MMQAAEQVLVVARSVLDELGAFQGLNFDVEDYLSRFWGGGVLQFRPRAEVEADPRYKQVIPYVIMSCGPRYLCYVRGKRAGEPRLVGNASIGIGGHINPCDDMPLFKGGFQEAYLSAVRREVAEEVCVDSPHTDEIVALINDDSNDVGKVHLGIVHHWRLERPAVAKREQMITELDFMSPRRLRTIGDSLESWSRLCLEHIDDIASRG